MSETEEHHELPDKEIFVCNYGVSTSACAKGALCYVIRKFAVDESMKVLARSRSGRWIEKWDKKERFYNFRLKIIPPQHPRYNDARLGHRLYLHNSDAPNEYQSELSNAEAQVIRRSMTLLIDNPVEALLQRLPSAGTRLIIGLAGVPGSGKSTVGAQWTQAVNARAGANAMRVLSMDGFHLTRAQLAQKPNAAAALSRRGAPWTFDAPALAARLQQLRAAVGQETVTWPDFRHEIGDPIADAHHIAPDVRLILVEGLYLLHKADGWKAVGHEFDERWYLKTPLEIARERLALRHMKAWDLSRADAEKRIAANDGLNAKIVLSTRSHADAEVRAD